MTRANLESLRNETNCRPTRIAKDEGMIKSEKARPPIRLSFELRHYFVLCHSDFACRAEAARRRVIVSTRSAPRHRAQPQLVHRWPWLLHGNCQRRLALFFLAHRARSSCGTPRRFAAFD